MTTSAMAGSPLAPDAASSAPGGAGETSGRNPPFPEAPDSRPLSLYGIAAVSAFVAAVVCLSLLAGYHMVVARQQQIGVVDIPSVMETSELMFTDLLNKPNVTDADREAAYALVKQTGPKLGAAIDTLQRSCGCVIMTKAAVVAGSANDYTLQVKQLLGIDKVDVKGIQERIRAAMKPKEPVKP